MNEYLLNPNVCPSSLNEQDEPMDVNDTAHKWDEQDGTCNECGASKDTDLSTTEEEDKEYYGNLTA